MRKRLVKQRNNTCGNMLAINTSGDGIVGIVYSFKTAIHTSKAYISMIPYQRNESLGLDYESGTKGHYNFGKLQEESARQQINMHKNERRGGEDFNTFVETVSLILPYLVYQHSYTEAPDSHG